MKKILPFIIALFFFQKTNAQNCTATVTANGPTEFCAGDSVLLKANVPESLKKADFNGGARGFSVAFTIGTKAYVGTGYRSTYKSDFWEYDPSTDVWTQKADFAGLPRGYATGFSIGNKGYIGTGTNGNVLKDFWEYDPATNSWTRKSDFGGSGRVNACGFGIGNKGYMGTGLDGNSNYNKDFWEYDPASDVWTRIADFGGTGRYGAASFVIGAKGYLGTGVSANGVNTKDFWEFNSATATWIQKADFGGSERYGGNGFVLGNSGFIGNGYSNTYMKDFWQYDASADTWTRSADCAGSPRNFAVSFSTGVKAFVGTGIDRFGYKADLWQYDPSTSYLWSNGETTSEIIARTSGNYTVTVSTTAPNCTATSAPVSVMVKQPSFSDTTAVVCNTFTWRGVTYKFSGDYNYVLGNLAGCDSTITLHLTIQSIHSTYTQTNAICYGVATGSIIITPTDGVYPYTYRIGTIRPFVSDSIFTGLRVGKYRITIYDAKGCAGISDQITLTQSYALAYSFAATDALCYGNLTGSFYINATGGIAPYKYKLGSTGIFDSVHSYANLRGGTYRVTVKDSLGCTINAGPIVVGQPAQVRATYTKTDETCPNRKDGTITMTDSVGTSPFVYKYGTVGTYNSTNTFTGLRAGSYRIFVRDANNCEGSSVLVPILQICSTGPAFVVDVITKSKPSSTKLLIAYPNPSTGKFTFSMNEAKTVRANLLITNESGMIVQQRIVNLQPFQNNINVDLQNNTPGIYFAKVLTGQNVQVIKLIVVRK